MGRITNKEKANIVVSIADTQNEAYQRGRADAIDEFLKIVNREIALLEDRESTETNEGRWVDEEKCLFAIERLEHLIEKIKDKVPFISAEA